MGRTFYHRNDIRPALMSMSLPARRVCYMWLASLAREKNLETGKLEVYFDPTDIFEIKVSEYAGACNIDYSAAYRQLRSAVKDLMSFVLTLDSKLTKKIDPSLPDDWIAPFQIAQTGTGYSRGEGFVRIRFAPELEPLVSELTTGFTGQFLESALAIAESNSSKLYLILREWVSANKYTNEKVILLDELRSDLGVDNLKSYKEYKKFKSDFFDRAVVKLEGRTEFSNLNMDIYERRARRAYKVKISWDVDAKQIEAKDIEINEFKHRFEGVKTESDNVMRMFNGKWLTRTEAEQSHLEWVEGLTTERVLKSI